MANFFDQFDEAPKTRNFFDQFDEKPQAKKSTVGSELVRGGKQLVSSIRTGAGALTGSPEEAALAGVARSQAIGEEAGEGASLEAVKKAYQERGLLSAAGEVAGQIPRALAGQVPQLAAMAGTAKLGAMAGAPLGPAGVIGGGILGAGASLLPQFFGSNIERQAAEQMARDEQVKIDRGAAGAAAAGQAAIEGAGTAFVLGKRIVKGVLGMADDAALTTAKAQQAMTQAAQRSLAASAGRGIAKGAVVEMPVEIAQSVLERAQAGLDVTSPEALSEYGEVAYQAGLVGGAIGAGAGPIDTAMARQGVKARTAFEEAEARRKAEAEAARLAAEAEAKAKIPPLALGAEGAFTPVALPDGSVAMTREELAQYEAEQFRKKYEPQKVQEPEREVLALGDQGVFRPVPLPDGSVAMTREDLARYEEEQFRRKYEPQKVEQPPVPEPYVKPPSISGTRPESLMAEPRDALAGVVSGRREAEEAKAEIPLADNYAFLQREKQRLLQQDQTPETKQLIGRIDQRLGEILARDIERQRTDKEKSATSVFAQPELPPVESRDVVVGGEELARLQAKERFPETAIDRRERQSLARLEKMREQPAPPESDTEKKLAELEKERRKIKSSSLYGELIGKLAPGDVSDISPDIGRNLRIKGNRGGAFLSDIVSSGMLDDYLPPDKRPGSITFDEQEATEYIKDKLRNKDHLTFDAQMQTRQIDEQIDQLRREAEAPRMAEYEISDVEPGEAASVERTAGEQAVGETVDDIRYQRGTAGGKSIGKEQTQAIVDAIRARWDNAPDTVVAENMDDPAIPQEVRDHNKAAIAAGAKGSPKGFFYKGKAYILADTMKSPSDVIETLFHESLGHYGLRGTFGPEMGKVLADVVKNRRADVEEKARQYGLDVNSESDMLEAAEEVLATIAQTKPGLSFVKRAIAVIRNFLRDLGLPFKMSNEDIIQKYILPARAFVEKGERRKVSGAPAAMRKGEAKAERQIYKDAEAIAAMDDDVRDNTEIGDFPGRSEAYNLYEARKILKKPSDKLKRVTDGNSFSLWQEWEYIANIDGDYFGVTKEEDPDAMDGDEDSFIYSYARLDDPRNIKTTFTSNAADLIAEIRADSAAGKPAAMREPAKAPPTESAAFKKWFGDSKIVDADGQPLVMYHGTTRDIEVPGTKVNRKAFFLTPDINFANRYALDDLDWFPGKKDSGPITEGGNVMPLYVSAKNPFDFENEKHMRRFLPEFKRILRDEEGYNRAQINELVRKAQEGNFNALQIAHENDLFTKLGFDAYYEVERGVKNLAVFGPTQVKSAIGNVGTYDAANPDIRFSRESATKTNTPAFKRWFGNSKVVDEGGKPLVVYHGTKAFDEYGETEGDAFTQFAGLPNWFAEEPYTASGYAGAEGTIYPAYLSIKSPLSITNFDMNDDAEAAYALAGRLGVDVRSLYLPEDAKAYNVVSSPQFVEAAQKAGYDGIKVKEGDYNTYAVFDPTQIKSATGNIGTYDTENADIRYQRDSITGKPILSQWTTPTDTKIAGDIGKDDIIYSLQNKMIDTKRVVDAISATVGKIAAKWNPYLQEELYHGRTAKQTKDFLADELRPLMQAMEKAGVTIADMETYLKNRHAIAYNAQVAKVNPNMPDKGSGIATADAQAYLDNLSPADKAKYEALAKRVDAITKGTRDLLVDSGLETKETIENWEKTFPFYVPLKRGDIDYAYTAAGMGTGQGFDVRGSFSQRAMGSEREATDVLANIAMMRERAIVKSQKNRVAQALFGLAAQNPNPQFWLPVDPLAEVSPENMQELINFGLSQEDLDFIAKEPRQKVIDKKRNEVVERINATLRRNENVLSMRFNGQDRYVFFNPNDPRSKRMAMSMKNLDADQLGNILGPISTITRWMAAVNTQYNPIFGAYNFLRDVQGAALQLSDTPLAGDRKAVVSGTLPALKGIYAAVRAERSGKKVEGPWAELWNDFQEQGGQTGFRDQFSRSQERAEALQKELNKITEGKAKAAGRAIFDWLSDYNDSMENAVRLSAYKAALDKGIGKEDAASIAKNLTVNFNRKGQIGVQAGALYAFFNAAVQGTTRLAQTLKGPAGKKIIAGGLLLGTMQAVLLAAYGYDEEEPPEFVRERNLIIPLEIFGIDDKYFAFPMPLGYHVIPGTSRILTEWALSGFKNTAERIASLTGMYLEAFNPIGNAGWSAQTLAPTFADPIVALTENKDWTGKPIAREDFSNLDPTPGYTRSKEATSVVFKEIAKFLNFASGGTDFKPGVFSPTPDQLEYLLGQATGGIGRELSKAATTVEKSITGEELPSYKIPLVGRFYGETKSSAAESNRFYKNMEKLNKHENEIKGRRENKQPVTEYLQENPEARLAPLARKVYNDVRELRKRREALIERDAPKESVQAVEKMITRKMQTLNDRVRAMEESEN